MTTTNNEQSQALPGGVMLNAYPDSIGRDLSDIIAFLRRPEMKDVFSLFYILPTFFHSDLDRGFSIIDYDLNEELVRPEDLQALDEMGINIKLDLVLNHLSVRSPQFIDLLEKGEDSEYRDFFIDWNDFWKDCGEMGPNDYLVPGKQYLDKLFMRKPDLPVLMLRFPDGSLHAYWNTFYQKVSFSEISARDFENIKGMTREEATRIADEVKLVISNKGQLEAADLDALAALNGRVDRDELIDTVCSKREFLGQMDLNACSEKVWEFYDETLRKLSGYGAKIIRLDAFAYLHKEPGQANFFNRPGTWEYLRRLRDIARKYGLTIFPEIHAEYGKGIHAEIAGEGYPIYDFFFPGLVIDALEHKDGRALQRWIREIRDSGLQTINMLGCHDGIPVLDLKGKEIDGVFHPGLLDDEHIDAVVECIIERGGRTKNLYDADGNKIDYYQVNATFFSALGEDEDKLLLARAIQMFMPGVPQVWYLDLFAGVNDYAAADRGRTAGHKEINRTTLKLIDVDSGLRRPVVRNQIELIRLRNTSPVFSGEMALIETGDPRRLQIRWQHADVSLTLNADLCDFGFSISENSGEGETVLMAFEGRTPTVPRINIENFPGSAAGLHILATDLDRTLLPNGSWPADADAIRMFNELTEEHGVLVVYVTGRDVGLTEDAIREFGIRYPHILIGDVGTSIRRYTSDGWQDDEGWIEHVQRASPRWDAASIRDDVAGIDGLVEQEREKCSRFKQSYYVDHDRRNEILQQVEDRVKGHYDEVIIYSYDSQSSKGLLDFLPHSATKQTALEYVAEEYCADRSKVVFCGDSGNDIQPLTAGFHGVLVRNADDQLVTSIEEAMAGSPGLKVYFARGGFKGLNGYYTSGVIEGAYHYGLFGD